MIKETKILAKRTECIVHSLAVSCIAEADNPFDVFSNPIAKAVIAELDRMVENGEIEDVVSSLDEIMMVIDWIEG